MRNKPLLVGITGGIGAGKSIVCEVFNVLKVPVYEADVRAKALMEESSEVVTKIKSFFGEESYLDTGKLNRTYLSAEVFNNTENLEKINQIVHPAVEQDFNSWVASKAKYSYVLKEAALLVETGSFKKLDSLIVVTAPENVRIQRVLKRDKHRTAQEVKAIISNQLAEEKKVEKAQFVINNDEGSMLLPQIIKINDFFINLGRTG
jgi:dephospho-CoA kinase